MDARDTMTSTKSPSDKVIILTRGYVAIVSARDYRRVSRYKWHTHLSGGAGREKGQPYARTNIGGKKVYLHRFVTEAPDYLHVDHKNHQTLDNRRENLEVVEAAENNKRRRKWKRK